MKTNQQANPVWVESLTRREITILTLMSQGLNNHAIAERETLAVSTVKWYVNQIFGKLGVNDRSTAVARANEVGLLALSIDKTEKPTEVRNNLPRQLTSFIGREAQIVEVARLVRGHQLVTLTGSAGVGKTRLALRIAEGLIDDFAEGVFLVELAPLTNPDLLLQVCAQALELVVQSADPIEETLVRFLEHKHLLLVLDNCEHLLEVCVPLTERLLKACPKLSILVTSREVFNLPGEHVYRVPSLEVPDPDIDIDLVGLTSYESVRLFIERAAQVSLGFQATQANIAAITAICWRLDGIPLAIELAASRVRSLAVEQISVRLGDAFHLLIGSNRSALQRHQMLKAAIDWSYNLLTPKERRLLQRLSSSLAGGL